MLGALVAVSSGWPIVCDDRC